MRPFLAAYDGYLRRKATQDIRKRMQAFDVSVQGPWALSLGVVAFCLKETGEPLWVVASLPLMAGLAWATWRFNKHGSEFDRTPPSAPWLQTKAGKALIQGIGRVAVTSLSTLTLRTRLRADLKFNDRDLYGKRRPDPTFPRLM